MKKSEIIVFTIFKVIYVMSAIAAIYNYIMDFISPTDTYCSLSSNDFVSLIAMTGVLALILKKECEAKQQ
ncbi:hypothetical protein [Ruminococcus flavefaciens]|uniref:hypothetical protein n=1 Tax=Ruminococcus flavefaciens TaxID=1265 RepID=UPI000467BC3D|nr:hypothetical protein [Ruminococcus flavefaciens]